MKRTFTAALAAALMLLSSVSCTETGKSSSGSSVTAQPAATMQNGTFAGEVKLEDSEAAMELSEKIYSIKPDKNGFLIEDGILYDYKGTEPVVHIPEGVTRIEARAFWSNTAAEAVYIPSTVLYIGDSAFWSCPSLRFVDIADGVQKISDCAFWSCDQLTDVNIPASVKVIGDPVFWAIDGLTVHSPQGSLANSFNFGRGIKHDNTFAVYTQ